MLLPKIACLASPGITIQLSTWRVVTFWCSFCPCVRACEKYSLEPLAQKYKGRVSLCAVDSDGSDLSMPRQQFNELIADRHLPYPVILDTDHSIVKRLNALVTPQTFVIDPAGHVVFDGMPDDSRRFIYDLSKLSGKRAVPNCYLSRALTEGLAGKAVTEHPPKDEGCSISW